MALTQCGGEGQGGGGVGCTSAGWPVRSPGEDAGRCVQVETAPGGGLSGARRPVHAVAAEGRAGARPGDAAAGPRVTHGSSEAAGEVHSS